MINLDNSQNDKKDELIAETEENEVLELDSIEGDDFSDDWDDEVVDEPNEENDDNSDDDFLDDLPEGMDAVLKDIEKYSKETTEESIDEVDDNTEPSDTDEIVEEEAPTAQSEKTSDETTEEVETLDLKETMNDIIVDDDIDEAALEEKYTELESVRESAEAIDAEMADLSYLEDLKKKSEPHELTAEEKKTQKQKQAEARKRKRQEENDLFARRYKAKSINAAVAQSSPIIYFYNAILTRKGNIQLFNVYQVLQDRFLGKLVPQLWMAVAEASDRVLELNMANLIEQIKVCDKYPEYEFIIQMSTRFFTKPAVLEKMIALIDHPVPNLVMSFDCVSLQNLGTAAKTGLAAIKEKGVKIVLDNTEKVSMTTLSELDFDYLRLDSRYYELGNFKSEGFLRLLTGFAKELGIPTIAMFCDDHDMVEYMLYMGVDMVQGNAISRPMRTIPNALGAVTPVESMTIAEDEVSD